MPLWAPPWASWFLFIISLNPHSLCNEAGSVIPGFSRRKPRLWEGVAALSRGGGGSWTPRVCLQSPACWGSHSRPFGQGFLSCDPATRVSPTLSEVPASAVCPLALAASSGSCRGVTQVTRCGYRRGLGWSGWQGEWVPLSAKSGSLGRQQP